MFAGRAREHRGLTTNEFRIPHAEIAKGAKGSRTRSPLPGILVQS